MNDGHTFSDEELVAYLDGEHEFARVSEIKNALKSDADLQSRIDALSIDREHMVKAFDALLDNATLPPELDSFTIPMHADAQPQRKTSVFSWVQVAAAVFVALGIGVFAGNFLADKRGNDWQSYVAAYQALYGNVTLAHINQSPDAAREELKRVSAAIGKSINLAELKSFDDLEYKRSQVLVFNDKPLVQVTFLSKGGLPVALCIIRSNMNHAENIEYKYMEEMESAFWSSNGYEFLLIGTEDADLIKRTANHFVTLL